MPAQLGFVVIHSATKYLKVPQIILIATQTFWLALSLAPMRSLTRRASDIPHTLPLAITVSLSWADRACPLGQTLLSS